MKTTLVKIITAAFLLITVYSCKADNENLLANDSMIIDHSCTDLFDVPVEYIEAAKEKLVIAYGHTSHGSQIISGMDGLDNFMTKHGYAKGLFDYNSDGSNDALELHDSPFDGASDLGNPDRTEWASATRKYLDSHSDINVVMWSWCGQAGWASNEEIDLYLSLMTELENDFPKVKFVYMTGHLDGTGKDGQLNQNNQRIRNYCKENKKILFDFADIESYDPDGKVNYMELNANDNCDYTTATGASKNWATDWQESHTENVDWYDCSAAHSQALNGNRKAFAAWWMFARMAGWGDDGGSSVSAFQNKIGKVTYTVKNQLLSIVVPSQQIDKVEFYDLKGNKLYCNNHANNSSEARIQLSETRINKSEIGIFRIYADGKCYSGKFIANTTSW